MASRKDTYNLASPRFGGALKKQRKYTNRVRKIYAVWTTALTTKLIREVEKREILWNLFVPEYRDRKLREQMWQQVATIIGYPRVEVTTRWNGVRGSFRVAYSKVLEARKNGEVAHLPSTEQYRALSFLEQFWEQTEPKVCFVPLTQPTPNMETNSPTPSAMQSPYDAADPLDPNDDYVYSDSSLESPPAAQPAPIVQPQSDVSERPQSFKTEIAQPTPPARQPPDTAGANAIAASSMERGRPIQQQPDQMDLWDGLGLFVAMNGRDWGAGDPELATQFRTAMYELIFRFQKKSEMRSQIRDMAGGGRDGNGVGE